MERSKIVCELLVVSIVQVLQIYIAIYIEYAKLNSIDIEATSIYWQNRYVTTMLKCFSIIPVEVWSWLSSQPSVKGYHWII